MHIKSGVSAIAAIPDRGVFFSIAAAAAAVLLPSFSKQTVLYSTQTERKKHAMKCTL